MTEKGFQILSYVLSRDKNQMCIILSRKKKCCLLLVKYTSLA